MTDDNGLNNGVAHSHDGLRNGTHTDGHNTRLLQEVPAPPATPKADLNYLIAALAPAREDLPRMPQQARSREKRDELLKAATAMFIERGYEDTTSDEIAAAAGVSVGTFYKYFRNKRQLLLTLVLERIEDIFSNLRLSALDFSHGNHRSTTRRAIAAVLSTDSNQNGLRRVWMELMSRDAELVPYQELVREHVLKGLEKNLRAVLEKGQAWPDLDVEGTSYLILTLLDTVSLRDYPKISDERLLESLTDMIYRAIFPPEKKIN